MSDWWFKKPESTTNFVLNPSAETTGNYALNGTAVISLSTIYSKYGRYCYDVATLANNDGIQITLELLGNEDHYVTMMVRGTLPPAWDWSLDGVAFTAPTAILAIDANWTLYGLAFPDTEANGSTTLYVYQNGGGAGHIYIDGVQVEQKDGYWTTYCDGDQEGCEWNGVEHASTSDRSAQSRAGGRLYDFEDDYAFDIEGMIGAGAAPIELEIDEYALLPGGELNSAKTTERTLLLTGVIRGTDWEDFHANKDPLVEELSPDRYPKAGSSYQPVRIWYTGAETVKEIEAHYERGLDGRVNAKTDPCYWERVAVRFRCPDPFWYEIGESAQTLDETDSATFRIVAGRLKATGQWNALGPPDVAGTYNQIFTIAINPINGHVFFGGWFTNFDNDGDADYIVEYDPEAGTWSPLHAVDVLNNYVRALAFGPDGTLYLGGNFTNFGDARDYFCSWDGTNYVAVGDPSAVGATITYVAAITIGLDGSIYVGGDFDTFANVPTADYIAVYSGGAWGVVSQGTGVVGALTTAPNGNIYIGGGFTNWGDGDGDYIVMWDPDAPALSSLSTGLSAACAAIVADNAGIVYIGGANITAGGVTVNYICTWNGTAFEAMSGGLNQVVNSLALGPDGILYAGGQFTADDGGKVSADRFIKWNGAAWAHLDLDLPGSPQGLAIACGIADPVVEQNYDIWIGFTTTGAGDLAGSVTINNPGTTHFYPRIRLVCTVSGTLYSVRNETTGKELLFNYTLLVGETLTIDLEPPNRSIVSSFFDSRPDAILPNSDFGSFSLQPGDNQITVFVD